MVLILMLCFGYWLHWIAHKKCTRDYFRPDLILRLMQSHCEIKISSDGDYSHALFELLIAWCMIIRCTRSYVLVWYLEECTATVKRK